MTTAKNILCLKCMIENIKFKPKEWREVIFSDEKKLNKDGADG